MQPDECALRPTDAHRSSRSASTVWEPAHEEQTDIEGFGAGKASSADMPPLPADLSGPHTQHPCARTTGGVVSRYYMVANHVPPCRTTPQADAESDKPPAVSKLKAVISYSCRSLDFYRM